jgi:cbb3-type cytochrome oxidase subunit 3
MLRVVAVLLGLAVYIWFIVDVLRTSGASMRILPKFVWLLIVILIPLLGGLLWLLGGRPRGERRRRRRGPTAPDDDPAFLRQIGDEAWVERMKRRRGDTDGPAPA